MRRNDREITDRARIDEIIRGCPVCRLAMLSEGEPYIVPMSFGYDGSSIYVHMANEGRKLDALRGGARICIEWDRPTELVTSEQGCGWGQLYESVIAWGTPGILTDLDERIHALDLLMDHYSGEGEPGRWEYAEGTLSRTTVVRITLDRVTAKGHV